MSTRTNGVVAQVRGPHLIVQELGDELVIFNRETKTAHMLNPEAAAVYRAAAGGTSIEDLAGVIEGGNAEQRVAAATLAISELATVGVVDGTLPPVSRRSLLRTIGAAAAVPTVISILAPTPAAAASNLVLGQPCTPPEDTCILQAICLGGHCCVPLGGFCNNPNPFCCGSAICDNFAGKCCIPLNGACTLDSDCCGAADCISSVCVPVS